MQGKTPVAGLVVLSSVLLVAGGAAFERKCGASA
jgi:hypothetical protein